MAQNIKDEEERNRRVLMVGEYVKVTGASTRKTAQYFTKTYFHISNATVSDYCARFMKLRPDEVDELREKINSNAPKTINDPEIKKRVLENTKLFLSGLTVNEIVETTNQDFWTVYRDLTKRLKLISLELYEEVAASLVEDTRKNLKNAK